MYAYTNLTSPKNSTSGIAEGVWLAPKDWFTSIKKPIADSNPGSEVVISENHTFLAKKGFVFFRLSPEKNAYETETIGDKGHTKFNHSVKIFVPGSYQEAHEQIKFFKDTPLIAIVRDSSCEENLYYQVGNGCMGAWMQASFGTGTTIEGVKGYEITISYQSDYVTLYAGALTMAQGYADAPQTITFDSVTNTGMQVNWAAVAGASGYVLERSNRPDFSNPTQVYSGTATTFAATGLTAGRTYYWRVRATHATLQDSRWNSASQATTNLTQLAVPTSLIASVTGSTTATLQANEPANALQMQWQVSESTDFNFSFHDEIVNVDEMTSPIQYETLTGLTASTEYFWRVRALAVGYLPSNWVTGTEFTTDA